MNLYARVQKLEKRAIRPFKPVQVIFQQTDELDKNRLEIECFKKNDRTNLLIVVTFVKSKSDSIHQQL
jgi:hypothetical protein